MLQTKNIIISGTNFWNPGDDFVRDGVIRVLHELFPDHVLNFLFYNFNQDFYPQSKFKGIHNMVAKGDLDKYRDLVDYIVIAGLSAGNEIKDLYEWIIDNNLTDRVYLIGAGYENKYVDKHIYKDPELTIFKNAKIITSRTKKAPKIINELGLPFYHINCPAILSVPDVKDIPENKKIERVAFSIQLPHEFGVSNHSCSNEMYLLAIEILTELYEEYEIEVIAHHKSEYFHFLKLFKEFNLEIPVIFSSFYQDLFEIYKRYDLIVTTRLHASLFANGFGIPGIILNNTDRHTHCLEGFPHSVWVNSKEHFFDQFEILKKKKLNEISVEAKQFKDDLLKKYIKVLSVAFGLSEQSYKIVTGTFTGTKADIEHYVKKEASSLEVKKRVLNNFKKLEQDYWLSKNIESYQKMIEDKNESSFDLVSFLNWYVNEFKPESYFEIGVRRGRSMCQIVSESPNTEIVGMDLWLKDYSSIPEKGIFTENPGPEFVQKELKKFGLSKEPNLMQGDSRTELIKFFNNKNNRQLFDLIVVDGDHTYDGAKNDLTIMFEHLKEGGVLVFDDITHPSHKELRKLWEEFKAFKEEFIFIEDLSGSGTGVAIKPPFTRFIKTNDSVISDKDLPLHFFTIVLNGKPFIEYHINVFKKLPFKWHWHIIEGVAELKNDTAWSLKNGAYISDELHRNSLSNDGTTEYIDSLKEQFPDNITVYRKENKQFWNGKLEMVNAPLKNIKEECILWQVDADELWTVEQLTRGRELYLNNPDKTASYYFCSFFVGERLVVSSIDTYGNHTRFEWLRSWRYKPGDQWKTHEPPALCRQSSTGDWTNLADINPYMHPVTQYHGLVFQHFAYTTANQLSFKEKYYGYGNALAQWQRLQQETKFPLMLKDFFSWVKDQTVVDRVESLGIDPLAANVDGKWVFNHTAYEISPPKKILLVRTDAIGDCILFSSILEPVKKKFSSSKLHILCQHQTTTLFENSPFVDHVIGFDKKEWEKNEPYRNALLEKLKNEKFDLVINTVFSSEDLTDIISLSVDAKETIGFFGDTSNISDEDFNNNKQFYSKLIHTENKSQELRNYETFLDKLEIKHGPLSPVVWGDNSSENFAERFFNERNLNSQNTIALFPFAKNYQKEYTRYSEIINNYPDYKFLIFGGKEKENQEELKNLSNFSNCINLVGNTSIRQMISLIKRCRLYIGADSSGAHIACALNIPNVVVLGGGHFGRFLPYSNLTTVVCEPMPCFGCGWKCKYDKVLCVQNIDPVNIINAVEATLSKFSEKPRVFVQGSYDYQTLLERFIKPENYEIIKCTVHYSTDEKEKLLNENCYLEGSNTFQVNEDKTSKYHNKETIFHKVKIEEAETAIFRNNYDKAVVLLDEIIIENPSNTDALNDLAVVDIHRKNWRSAFDKINEVLRAKPDDEIALNNLKVLESELNTEKNSISRIIEENKNDLLFNTGSKSGFEEIHSLGRIDCKKNVPTDALLVKYKQIYHEVHGWLTLQAVEVLNYFNRIQLLENIQGDIFEIGAFKGKLTLLLAAFLRRNEILGVCDIFDNQNLNLSSSGKGANLKDFKKNMKLLFDDLSFIKLYQKRSDLLMPYETGNNNRMFSVDGGHSKKETYDDLVIATNSINEKGIIILDDYHNTNWPGVKDGADEFLMNNNDVVPLAAFFNKFVFVKKRAREYYLDLLINNGFESFCKAQNYKVGEENLLSHSFLKIYQ